MVSFVYLQIRYRKRKKMNWQSKSFKIKTQNINNNTCDTFNLQWAELLASTFSSLELGKFGSVSTETTNSVVSVFKSQICIYHVLTTVQMKDFLI